MEMLCFQSTKKRYSNFLKKVFVFQKTCFKFKVLKTFKISSEKMPILQTDGYFENSYLKNMKKVKSSQVSVSINSHT